MNEMTNLVDMPDWMRERMTAQGVENGVHWVVAEGSMAQGQMNGYVLLPEWSVWRGVPYPLIEGVKAHARHYDGINKTGLTYGEDNWVGFAPNDGFDDVGKFASVDEVAGWAADLARQFALAAPSQADVERIKGWVKYEREAESLDEQAAYYAGFNAGRTIKVGE